ncbi:hypothetical protein NLU13_7628 [Sarocladium strictum]|uniref:Phosphotransferase n=1 Tax=Sarocladium strictum TaxID=5046 RepID=A0AA39GD52_SARSR|nr:hypothetical protein NLU13_7628 [Sarocladium strictum]
MTLQKTLLAAIVKSLLRGKSLVQAILNYWITPLHVRTTTKTGGTPLKKSTIQAFLKEAEAAFLGPISGDDLRDLSSALRKQFRERLQTDLECMLPSYSHQLPTGNERGQYLALDVGGSTLRVALVQLRGRSAETKLQSEILESRSFKIDKPIKDLEGMAFFEWMASRINETLSGGLKNEYDPEHPLPMALAWSFPIEQTSLGGGKLGPMGKGFLANEGLLGEDLGDILRRACHNRGLNVEVEAIINDSSACLLSQAYGYPTTRFGLILGTGLNIAVYLPVLAIGRTKFGTRPEGWFDEASHVIVNTELGMFGHDILPWNKWDRQVQDGHSRPHFQPLELLVSGMYLGEVARYTLIDAIETTGIFGGIVPSSLRTPYSLATETLSLLESDTSDSRSKAIALFSDTHPSPHTPTAADISALQSLASFISIRSSALVATCVYTLWDIRLESQRELVAMLPTSSQKHAEAQADVDMNNTVVSFNGSVIENYPGYRASCQKYVEFLLESNGHSKEKTIELVPAKESSLLGAAVASACVVRDG